MALTFDSDCQQGVDLAKRAVPDGQPLAVDLLIASLYHATGIQRAFPGLTDRIPRPTPARPAPIDSVALAEPLKPVFRRFLGRDRAVTAAELFLALIDTHAGAEHLMRCGIDRAEIEQVVSRLEGRSAEPATPHAGWRASEGRQQAIQALSSFGRLLTDGAVPGRRAVERDGSLKSLVEILSRMGRRNAIIVGDPGTGKTALVYELARRILEAHPSIPPRLREADVFELSPVFLRSGASVVGQYEERVRKLIEVLRGAPNVILFVDEIHSLLQSGIHERGPFSDANEAFKAALGHNQISCIGCTTLAEYRRFIEPDRALVRRFSLVRLDPPAREATLGILRSRLDRLRAHYAPLQIPETILGDVIDLTDEYAPALYQPDKSIQLLDAACAACSIEQPPAPEVTPEFLRVALADLTGYNPPATNTLTEDGVYGRLRANVLGQDEVIRGIARAFVAGLGDFLRRTKGPRGVFLFGGPTGVGKTATALDLASLLGGANSLIRVDCNTLQGSGYDSGPAINRLIGAPPGYVGYARGQGGVLSRIRDCPQSIVLFDEFEKADPGVGELLLRIMDEGRAEDHDGNVLDFRKAFIIFTSNAGCVYDARGPLGFVRGTEAPPPGPRVEQEAFWADLRRLGLGQEFQGRIPHQFFFKALGPETIAQVLAQHLGALRERTAARGFALSWEDDLVPHLMAKWQQHLGARSAAGLVRGSIEEQLRLASSSGELEGVRRIRVCVGTGDPTDGSEFTRTRVGETLDIVVT